VSRPVFIALEGMDGTGKSTLARALCDALDACLLRTPPEALAPARPDIDAALAPSAVATQLFYAATVALASDQARRLLAEGRSVVMDRYWASTLAYAQCRSAQVELDAVARALLAPDLTVYLTADDRLRARRLARRGMSVADRASLAQRAALRAAYELALQAFPGGRLLRLDTGGRAPAKLASEVLGGVASIAREAA
jgi:dTMP kinase